MLRPVIAYTEIELPENSMIKLLIIKRPVNAEFKATVRGGIMGHQVIISPHPPGIQMLRLNKNPHALYLHINKKIDERVISDFLFVLQVILANGRHISVGIIRSVKEHVGPYLNLQRFPEPFVIIKKRMF